MKKIFLLVILFSFIALSQTWDVRDNERWWKKKSTTIGAHTTPQAYGAVADGVTNDSSAFVNGLNAVVTAGGGRFYIPEGTYLFSGQMNINLSSTNIEIYSERAVILFDDKTSGYDEKDTAGIWIFHGAGSLTIDNIHIKATNYNTIPTSSGNYLSALTIYDCDKLSIQNVEVDSSIFAGLHAFDIGQMWISNSKFRFCHYAGVLFKRVTQATVIGNDFSYNGLITGGYAHGYGIAGSHRNGQRVDNKEILYQGNQCLYNYRKGLDVHGGHGVHIMNNYVKGYCVMGISAVNQAGSDPDVPYQKDTSWYKWIKDVIVGYNVVENDSLWLDSLSGVYSNTQHAIAVGSYSDSVFSGGTIEVIGNILRKNNSPIKQRSPIFVFVPTGGEREDAVIIKDNTIMDVKIDTANYATDGVIYLVNGTLVPRFCMIAGNYISGTAYNGIKVNWINSGQAQETIVKFLDNEIEGDFTYPYYCRDDNITSSNNTYNHVRVPDLINTYVGTLKLALRTSGSADSLDIVNWDLTSISADRLVTYKITVFITNALASFASEFNFHATCGDDGGTSFFQTGFIDSTAYKGYSSALLPTVSWTPITSDNQTLKIHTTNTYAELGLFIKITSWGIPIWKSNG